VRLQRDFALDELAERLNYCRDATLEELVEMTISRGYSAVDDEGQARLVLELNRSGTGAVHRQFFELQPREAGISDLFFLENQGSVDETDYSRFRANLRKDISTFLKGLPATRNDKYKPLLVQQEKLARKMIIYEATDGRNVMEFTRKVVSLERSNLYGLFHLPHGPFIFFGKESQRLFREDFLEADERYNHLVQEFLRAFRPSTEISRISYSDREYDRPSGRPRAFLRKAQDKLTSPARCYSITPRIQVPAVAQWQNHLHGLATPIRETSGLEQPCDGL